VVLREPEISRDTAAKIAPKLGFPVFVKPANMGSSVGIERVSGVEELISAVQRAFQYDVKILVEQNINGREIECAVLGNRKPMASIAGEIIPRDRFYSYDAKYIEEDGATLKIPAGMDEPVLRSIQETAVASFQVLECSGMARVDMFLTEAGRIYLNEVNTIPGFTKISMYPKLWESSGISYTDLIDRLIQWPWKSIWNDPISK